MRRTNITHNSRGQTAEDRRHTAYVEYLCDVDNAADQAEGHLARLRHAGRSLDKVRIPRQSHVGGERQGKSLHA